MSTEVRFSGFDGRDRVWGHLRHSYQKDNYPDSWVFWGKSNGGLIFHPAKDDAVFRKYCVAKKRKYSHIGPSKDVVINEFGLHLIVKKLKYGN